VEKVEGVRFGNRGRAKDGRRKSRKSRTEHKVNRRVGCGDCEEEEKQESERM